MAEERLRQLQRRAQADPVQENIVPYLHALHQNNALDDATLIAWLGIAPYDEQQWPWYSDSRYGADRYNPMQHDNLLRLVAAIRPRQILLDILTSWSYPRDLTGALNVVWRKLLEQQAVEILGEDRVWEIQDNGESLALYAAQEGLARFPTSVHLDWEQPWSYGDWGYFPEHHDPIVTMVMDGNYQEPDTVTDAYRCYVRTDSEPNSECIDEHVWDNGRWHVENRYERGPRSQTLVPYKEYCHTHNRDWDDCDPCPACEAPNHRCYCIQCDDCEAYSAEEGLVRTDREYQENIKILPHMRCHCACRWAHRAAAGLCIYAPAHQTKHPDPELGWCPTCKGFVECTGDAGCQC